MSLRVPSGRPTENSSATSTARGWLVALIFVLLLLAGTYAEGLSGKKAIDGAAMLPYEDAIYGPMAVNGPLPGRGGSDSTPELYNQPWDTLAWHELTTGHLPLWQPYNGLGKPLLASAQIAPFNPFKLLFVWHGARGLAQAWFLVLRLAFAGVGTLLLARRYRLSALGGALAAAGFMLNGTFIYHFQYSDTSVLVMLPWLLLAAERLLEAPALPRAAVLGLLIGLTGLLGHPEPALFGAAAAGLMVGLGAVRRPEKWSIFGLLAIAVILGAGLAASTVLPFFEFVHHGESYLLATGGNWQPSSGLSYTDKLARLIGYGITGTALDGYRFNPYVGTLTLALVPFGLTWQPMRRAMIALFGLAALAFFTCWPGEHVSVLPFVLHSTYMLPLMSLGLALYGGAGLDSVVLAPRRVAPAAIGCLLAIVAYRLLVIGGGLIGARVFLLTVGIAIAALAAMWWRANRLAPILLLASVAAQLYWTARLIDPPQPKFDFASTPMVRYLQAQPGPFRLTGGFKALLPDSNLMFGLESIDSYEAFNVERYARYMGALDGYACGSLQRLTVTEPFVPELLSLANVKYALVPDPQPKSGPLASYPIIMRQGQLALRENPNAMPRAWVSYGADFVSDEATAAKNLRATASRWLTRVLLETPGGKAPVAWQDTTSAITPVKLLGRDSQNVTLEATLTHPGWLVLSDIYYPGWKAEVDGKPAQILPADVAFRAVYLAPGTHRVVFKYASRTVALGFGITLLALLTGLGLLFIKPGRTKQGQQTLRDAA